MLLPQGIQVIIGLNLFPGFRKIGHLWAEHLVQVLDSFAFLRDYTLILFILARELAHFLSQSSCLLVGWGLQS